MSSIDAGMIDYKEIQEIIEYDKHLNEHNIEQLAAKLLFELTRNTGFEVSKEILQAIQFQMAEVDSSTMSMK